MKKIIFCLLPSLFFAQRKVEWTSAMQAAIKNIQNRDYKSAIVNLDKTLAIEPKNSGALYFKAHSQILAGQTQEGCKTMADAIFYNSESARNVYSEKCMDFDPKLNPEKFKTGKFSVRILGDSITSNFERRNDMQIEKYDDKIMTGKLIWVQNGDYAIIPADETAKANSEDTSFDARIIKIEGNEYLYEEIADNEIQFGIVRKEGE